MTPILLIVGLVGLGAYSGGTLGHACYKSHWSWPGFVMGAVVGAWVASFALMWWAS